MISRKLLTTLIVFLAALPGISVLQALPATEVYNVLERLDVKISPASAELTIRFSIPVNYIGHTPQKSGKTILIRVKPLAQNAPDVRNFKRNPLTSTSFKSDEVLSWKSSSEMPLQDVRYIGSATGGAVIEVNFTRAVSFNLVQSNDFRSMTLIVAGTSKAETNPKKSGRKSRYNYTINLNTSSKSFDLARVNSKEYPAGLTFYTMTTNVEGKTLHHLRVGFFHTAAQIRDALKAIRPYYKKARVMLASRNDIKNARNANPRLKLAASPSQQPKSIKNESARSMMNRAKRSLIGGKYQSAIVLYSRVIKKFPNTRKAQDAQEFLGVAHQRSRQFAHATKIFKKYLKKYPKSKDTLRVKQRLNALLTASKKPRNKLKNRQASKKPKWRVRGNVFSTLRYDKRKSSTSPTKTDTTTFVTSLNATATRSTKKDTVRIRFSGSYINNDSSVSSAGNDYRISYMYYDYQNKLSDYSFRLGRQSKYSGGVQGRFDGVSFDYRINERWKVNTVAGFPVNLSTNGAITTDKYFVGLNVDLATNSKYLTYNLFSIFQTVDGISDRESIGGEIRYLHPKHSLFVVSDYDTSYQALNKLLVVGNWRFNNKATLNVSYDYRRSPLLTTSNALQGQSVASIRELLLSMSEAQIRQLAEDRTAAFRSFSVSGSYPLGANWLLNGDFVVSNLDATTASGGVAATLGTDNEFFYTAQAIRSNLFKSGDSTAFSVRYADTTNYDKWTYSALLRYPLSRKWRVVPRIEVDFQDLNDGSDIRTIRTALRFEYRAGRRHRFEFETGYTSADFNNSTNDRTDTNIYYNINFIANF
ncbi:hypothetical protein MNBD_GAMMA12-2866 [hydrothermal vent metagenome]|uniref:Uncharacterized protein n=1 Tax=hydrothermal vent metagenome TaxID=652676 RepID=A0A3B0ZGK0_9ZZZZ